MTIDFAAAMREAAARARANDPMGATRLIQEALTGKPAADAPPPPAQRTRRSRIDPEAEIVEPVGERGAAEPETAEPLHQAAPRRRRPLRDVVRALREARSGGMQSRQSTPPPVPAGARFEAREHTGPAGARSYKLYVPSCAPEAIRGLVVMLHGCKQNPDDFATGTGMNTHAETHNLVVAYPRQGANDNAASCWNWFEPGHQARDRGEPAILAALTRALLAEFGLAPGQAYVAGLSAGGAMAAVLAATHPELFSAVGIHSGLAHGAASDVVSAFAAMRGDGLGAAARPASSLGTSPRTIVFHGSADRTVHPANAERIVAAATGASVTQRSAQGSAGGRSYTRTVFADAAGVALAEDWRIDGSGHAWSGGSAAGSYADPSGPDASAEMLRFFLAGG